MSNLQLIEFESNIHVKIHSKNPIAGSNLRTHIVLDLTNLGGNFQSFYGLEKVTIGPR